MARNANLFLRSTNLPVDNSNSRDQANSGAPKKGGYDDTYGAGVNRRMSDLRYGGQFGYSPDFTTWVNMHPYVSRNLIPILVEPPLFFRTMPNPDVWIAALRSLVETMPRSIQGLNGELQVSTASTPFGGAGQEFEVYTNVKEQKPEIQFTWVERVGMPIQRFLQSWIRYGMMDQNTKVATVNTIAGSQLSDMMADQYSMTMLFIEPDEMHRFVTQAWLVTNMFPKSSGTNTAKMDKASDMEMREYSVQFAGISQYGAGVDDFAQTVLSTMKITGADPHAREAFQTQISGYVQDLIGQGYKSSVATLAPLNRITNPKNNGEVGGVSGSFAARTTNTP